jgi:hypothetical protein
MRTIITIAMLLIANATLAQMQKVTTYFDLFKTRIKETYTLNLKTGFMTGYYKQYKENGNGLSAEGMYNESYKTGKWIYYNPLSNGNTVLLIENYNSKGQLHGEYNGKTCVVGCPLVKGHYVNDKKEGKFYQYRSENVTQIEYIANYKNGELEGDYLTYYKDGLLERKEKYHNRHLVDTAYEYIDSKVEPRLKNVTVYKDGVGTQISKTTSEDKRAITTEEILSKVKEFISADAAFKQWKVKVDNEKGKNVTRDDYDYVIDFITRFFYSDYADLCNNNNRFFFFPEDREKAVLLVYKFMKQNNGLSNEFKSDLIWEVGGHKYCYPLSIGEDSPLIGQIRQSNVPYIDEHKVVFSSPLAAYWLVKKLVSCTERNKSINSGDIAFIQAVFERNR